MTLTTVVNLKREPYDVYIGRGSMWGNPFKMGSEADRERVIQAYKKYLKEAILRGEISILDLKTLKGKRLGCYCKPKGCHGDVIAAIVNAL